ncbi:hypothetical protein AD998_02015 [bacterium 336/3]|nr:hypothetical protein AD998_02015 [bacterium 336/3]
MNDNKEFSKEDLKNQTAFTKEELECLEKEYGTLTILELTKKNSEEKHVFCFKEINKKILKSANAKMSQSKIASDFIDVVLESTIINGKELLDDAKIYWALQGKMDEFLNDYSVEVVKKR